MSIKYLFCGFKFDSFAFLLCINNNSKLYSDEIKGKK